MRNTYITPSVELMEAAPEATLMATSLVIDAEKSGSEALIKDDNEWNIWDTDSDQ